MRSTHPHPLLSDASDKRAPQPAPALRTALPLSFHRASCFLRLQYPTVQSKPKARIAGICTKLASTLVGWSRSLAFSTASFDEGTKGARGPFWHPTRDTT